MNVLSSSHSLRGMSFGDRRMVINRLITKPLCFALPIILTLGAPDGFGNEPPTRLGLDLTPMGAERAGSQDANVPEWRDLGAVPQDRATELEEFFLRDIALQIIRHEDVAENAQYLSEGHRALFGLFPETFEMRVHESKRTCAAPPHVYEAISQNEVTAGLTNGGNNISGARIGPPFPIPDSALEMVWNHLLAYRGFRVSETSVDVAPLDNNSDFLIVNSDEKIFRYADPGLEDVSTLENVNMIWRRAFLQHPTLPGSAMLFRDPVDHTVSSRQNWLYNAGNRRTQRQPPLIRDQPLGKTNGIRYADTYFMFNGGVDQYDWRVVGKREMLVPYNNYRLRSPEYSLNEVIQAGHLNQQLVRYERHRVWIVEGYLKIGRQHTVQRRRMYLDEDTWIVLLAELFDQKDSLVRFQEAYITNHFEVPVCVIDTEIVHHLPSKRYHVEGLRNGETPANYFPELREEAFVPRGLRNLSGR